MFGICRGCLGGSYRHAETPSTGATVLPVTTATTARSTLGRLAPLTGLAALALVVPAGPAADSADAKVKVGVYQDNPIRQLAPLRKPTGSKKIRTVSTYVTAGAPLSPSLIRYANRNRIRLIITWYPDGGKAGARQPKYRLQRIKGGKLDKAIRALGRQTRALRIAPIIRPMPEMNTPWYPWSGKVNGNSPGKYRLAFRRVSARFKAAGGKRLQIMWSPYVRSIPDRTGNEFAVYYPGAKHVNIVGVSGYNFGNVKGLAWTEPYDLFRVAYRDIVAIAPKPFWIAETGSTNKGGDKSLWMTRLLKLDSRLPRLKGVVFYDVKEKSGDFRVRQNKRTSRIFAAQVRRRAK